MATRTGDGPGQSQEAPSGSSALVAEIRAYGPVAGAFPGVSAGRWTKSRAEQPGLKPALTCGMLAPQVPASATVSHFSSLPSFLGNGCLVHSLTRSVKRYHPPHPPRMYIYFPHILSLEKAAQVVKATETVKVQVLAEQNTNSAPACVPEVATVKGLLCILLDVSTHANRNSGLAP